MAFQRSSSYRLLLTLLAFFGLFGGAFAAETGKPGRVDVYLFWQAGCPHCERAIGFLKQWEAGDARVKVHFLEIGESAGNREAFRSIIHHAGIERPAVPLAVIGESIYEGYADDSTTGAELKSAASACLESPCGDIVWPLLSGQAEPPSMNLAPSAAGPPKVLELPVFGEVDLAHVSLPVLTLMLGAVDGFNPCALWTLVFLLDDLCVFFVAMQTLRIAGLTGAYVRQSHLVGGVVLILIGFLLLLKPEWLAFA